MKDPKLAELYAFGLLLDQRIPIEDMRPIFLIHRPPIKFNYDLDALSGEPIARKARFEWQGKWNKSGEYPIYVFIGLE